MCCARIPVVVFVNVITVLCLAGSYVGDISPQLHTCKEWTHRGEQEDKVQQVERHSDAEVFRFASSDEGDVLCKED